LLCDRAGLTFRAGTIDSHIQAAEQFESLIDQPTYLILLTYVGLQEFGFCSDGSQFLRQCMPQFRAPP
jgi:hypothetical protein